MRCFLIWAYQNLAQGKNNVNAGTSQMYCMKRIINGLVAGGLAKDWNFNGFGVHLRVTTGGGPIPIM